MEEKIYKLLDFIKKSVDACPDYEKIKELTPKIRSAAVPVRLLLLVTRKRDILRKPKKSLPKRRIIKD